MLRESHSAAGWGTVGKRPSDDGWCQSGGRDALTRTGSINRPLTVVSVQSVGTGGALELG